eukprot:TRINITY_DN689_c0_g1_i1.p1 TRINITY_DN689_c0_g1~~TRINITY_DN689_c0_g1_i1.p1  ORF type:complete len:224 (-),score=38.74 TRINITY_DN689_c0_g1_i1:169-804(-)
MADKHASIEEPMIKEPLEEPSNDQAIEMAPMSSITPKPKAKKSMAPGAVLKRKGKKLQNAASPAPAIAVFLLGWICCPIWCAGIYFRKSKNRVAQILGFLSLMMATIASLLLLAFIIYTGVTYKRTYTPEECTQSNTDFKECLEKPGCGVCYFGGSTDQCQADAGCSRFYPLEKQQAYCSWFDLYPDTCGVKQRTGVCSYNQAQQRCTAVA